MDVARIIGELIKERAAVETVIAQLEKLAANQRKRRGRPLTVPAKNPPKKRKPLSEETKHRMAAAQKKRWADYRKSQEASAG